MDNEPNNKELTEVPKIGLWQRITGGSAFEQALHEQMENARKLMEEATKLKEEAEAQKRANDEKEQELARKEANLDKREENIEKDEIWLKARKDNLYYAEDRMKSERNIVDIQRQQLKEKEAKLDETVKNIETQANTRVENAEAKLQQTIDLFRERENVPQEISSEALTRDQVISNALQRLYEEAERIFLQQTANEGVFKTSSDRASFKNAKRNLKSMLLGIVAAYRDMLPEDEINSVVLDGKTITLFMQDLAKSIRGKLMNEEQITSVASFVSAEYVSICNQLGVKPARDINNHTYAGYTYYDGNNPFNMKSDSDRNVGRIVFKGALNGNRRTMTLMGDKHERTADIGEQSAVEQKMEENAEIIIDEEER